MTSKAKDKDQDQDQEPETRSTAAVLADDFRALLDSRGTDDGHAQLFRKVQGAEDDYLEQIPTRSLRPNPLEVVKARHGGGSYRMILRDGEGKYIKGGSFHFSIAGPPKSKREEELDAREEEEDRLRDLERMMREKAADASTGDLVRFMMEEMREIRRDMRRPPPEAAGGNFMEMAVSLASTIQASQAPLVQHLLERQNNVADQLETMKALLEVAQSLGGGGGGGDPMSSIARTLAPSLAGLLNQHVEMQGGRPPVTTANPNPPPGPALPAWAQHLAPHMPTLLEWARDAKNPELHGAFVLDHLPDEHLDAIYAQLTRDGYLEEVVQVFPAAAQHRAWFDLFFREIRDGLTDAPEAPPTGAEVGTGSPPGDTGS